MNTPKNPSTAATVNQSLDHYEQECLDELLHKTERDSRRQLVHLCVQFGPQDVATMELRTFAKGLDVDKGQTGRVRRLAMLSASFTIAVRRCFSIKANFLRNVERK